MSFLTDDELIAAYEAGDQSAFSTLLDRHLGSVYNFALRLTGRGEDADDIAQETFVKAWKNLSRFRKGASFKTWLLSITRNTAIDHLRKKKPLLFAEFGREDEDTDFEHSLPDKSQGAEQEFDDSLQKETLEGGMRQLPVIYREILILRYREGLSLEESARVLKVPLNTAKSRDRRAQQALHNLIGHTEPKEGSDT